MSFKQQLIKMKACKEAIDWVEDRTIQQAWKDCSHGDWMLWLLEMMKKEEGWPDEKQNTLFGCWCARRALKYVPEGETRPLKAIEAKEKWAKGEITREEMIAARTAARSVALASAWDAASSAANAAAWASVSIAARYAAWAAANDAARVAASAANAAARVAASATAWGVVWDAAYDEELSIQADYIRTQFTPPKGNLCLSNNS